MKTILWILGLYLLYRFIFNFILPLYRNTQVIRRQFRDMQAGMKEQFTAQQDASAAASSYKNSDNKKPVMGEYIDFEEIKN